MHVTGDAGGCLGLTLGGRTMIQMLAVGLKQAQRRKGSGFQDDPWEQIQVRSLLEQEARPQG